MGCDIYFPMGLPAVRPPRVENLERFPLRASVRSSANCRFAPLSRLACDRGHRLYEPDGRQRFLYVANDSELEPQHELQAP
jgi:hypothetical protein